MSILGWLTETRKNDHFVEQMEEAFRPRNYRPRHTDKTVVPVRTLEEFHSHHPVRPVPSGTVHRAAYFRRPEVQAMFDAVELVNVDDDLKRELRSISMFIVSELAGFSERLEHISEELQEMHRELDKLKARHGLQE